MGVYIDMEMPKEGFVEILMKGWNACLRSVQQQPTIIPAEEGE